MINVAVVPSSHHHFVHFSSRTGNLLPVDLEILDFFPAEYQTEGNARVGTPVGLQEDWNYSRVAGITTVLGSASQSGPSDVRQAER